jgi:protein O-mannosyl-transferase
MSAPLLPWPRLPWRRRLLMLAAAMALAFAGYASSLGGDFVFDDGPLLLTDSCHWGVQNIPDMFTPGIHSVCGSRPVRSASYALDHGLWGLDPFGYHLTNVVIHGLTVLALGILVWRLGGRARLAALAAALFALHPVGTEAVSYISGRRDLLAALFSLLSLTAYLSFRARGGVVRLALSLGLLLAGIYSHESAAALPAVLVLLELCLAARRQPGAGLLTCARALLHPRLAIPLGGVLVLVLGIATWKVVAVNISGRHELWGGSLPAHLANALRMHALYLKQVVWPLELVADYSADAFPISRSLLEPRALAAAALVLGVLGIALASWRRAPLLATATLGYFIMLLPSSQIVVHHELVAEHRLYLSMAGFCVLVAAGLDRLIRTRGRLAWGLVAVLLLSYLALTNNRNLDWRSEETLWSRTVAQVPNCARALTNLGALRGRQGKLKEANALLERAVAIRPTYCHANVNLGKVLVKLGGPGQATRGISLLSRANCLPPDRQASALASAYSDLKQWDLAAAAFRRSLGHNPDSPKAHLGLARALQRSGEPGAEAAIRAALRSRPGYGPALYGLGELLAGRCQVAEARSLLERLQSQVAEGSPRHKAVIALLTGMSSRCK